LRAFSFSCRLQVDLARYIKRSNARDFRIHFHVSALAAILSHLLTLARCAFGVQRMPKQDEKDCDGDKKKKKGKKGAKKAKGGKKRKVQAVTLASLPLVSTLNSLLGQALDDDDDQENEEEQEAEEAEAAAAEEEDEPAAGVSSDSPSDLV
jgi:hypothetical protein